MRSLSNWWRYSLAVAATIVLGGCVLAPDEAKEQRARLHESAGQYRVPFEQRSLPELPPEPTWRDVLRRAFLANGELEVAYHEWAMAVARIPQRGAYPNTPVMLGFEYMFSAERMKSFDRMTVTGSFDPMENLAFPSKAYRAGAVATREAEAAGQRFLAAKFALQRRVLRQWSDYALRAEQARVQRENVALLRLLVDAAAARVRAGAPQADLLRTEIELRLAENRLADVEAEVPQIRARLNALLGRVAEAPLLPPARLPAPRPVPADDAALLAAAAESNPELAALAREVHGRRDALELARLQYIPDFTPFAGFTGSIEQFVGIAVSLPTVLPRIRGMIDEARADLRRMQAMSRQVRLDREAELVAALLALRNSERQAALFADPVLPTAERVLAIARQSYTAGTVTYLELIESQRTLLDVRLMLAEASAEREKSLADVEALAGVDVEALVGDAASWPSTEPAVRSSLSSDQEVPHGHE